MPAVRKAPPAANFRDENKHVDFADSPVYVNREPADWAADDTGPRLAGVSSFGYSGTNAHVIIEEYPAAERRGRPLPRRRQLVPLSAKTDAQLRQKAGALAARLRNDKLGDDALQDVAYTLQVGREAFPERLAVSADSMSELIKRLEAFAGGADAVPATYRGGPPKTVRAGRPRPRPGAMWTSSPRPGPPARRWTGHGCTPAARPGGSSCPSTPSSARCSATPGPTVPRPTRPAMTPRHRARPPEPCPPSWWNSTRRPRNTCGPIRRPRTSKPRSATM
ncbi:ketoacyl-synthetase C-terminal extension domain-containing protein [Streptomyces sp. FXJ1.4098]|nr:ketoacyl-synthetase C-terminal extension domain-containing protein [Streptomyces sp. FXJ1.4098]